MYFRSVGRDSLQIKSNQPQADYKSTDVELNSKRDKCNDKANDQV